MEKPKKTPHKMGCNSRKENNDERFCDCWAKQQNDLCDQWEEYLKAKVKLLDSVCDVCWTSSWAPVPKDDPNARQVKGTKEYVICQMCEAEEALIKHRDASRIAAARLLSVDDMSDATHELLDQYFPKGKCKERGQALMLYSRMLIAIHKLLLSRTGTMERAESKTPRKILEDLHYNVEYEDLEQDEGLEQALHDLNDYYISNIPSVEKIRLELLENIGWFTSEWETRPKSGKGSDRSDLLERLAQAIHTFIAERITKAELEKEELQKYFERKYLKGTCFDSLEELLKDKTNWQVNIVRCLIAVELKGVWRGLQDHRRLTYQ